MPFDRSAAPGSLGTFRVLAAVIAAFVLLQAVLAGQFLFRAEGARSLHRYVGEGLALVAVAVAVQGWRLRHRSAGSWWLALVLLVLVVAATGLGFAGRKRPSVAAMHIPVSVATFGVAVAAAVLDRPRSYR